MGKKWSLKYKNSINCNKPKGFSQKQFCKYKKGGKKTLKKKFLYNPNNPKKSFDVYIDKNPKDTIHIKYSTLEDVNNTIHKLEKLYKSGKYSHKRIWQVAMIMKVRLKAILDNKSISSKNIKSRYNKANQYFKFLKKRTKTPKLKRKKLNFN